MIAVPGKKVLDIVITGIRKMHRITYERFWHNVVSNVKVPPVNFSVIERGGRFP
jgi:hypothetical protein